MDQTRPAQPASDAATSVSTRPQPASMTPEYGKGVRAPIRNPSVAVILSVIPGLGQVYNGDLVRGIALFLATVAGLVILIVPGICVWIFSIYDAFTTAERISRSQISFSR